MAAAVVPAAVWEALAVLLEYPGEGFGARAGAALEVLRGQAPALAGGLAPYAARVQGGADADLEELYTRTFDWNPERALEVGWHLYGEQYDRGAYLVRLREALRAHGVEEGQDLPDHLGTVLRLLPRLPAEEVRRMAAQELVPATRRMGAGFGDEDNPYRAVLAAVLALLESAGAAPADAPLPGGR